MTPELVVNAIQFSNDGLRNAVILLISCRKNHRSIHIIDLRNHRAISYLEIDIRIQNFVIAAVDNCRPIGRSKDMCCATC